MEWKKEDFLDVIRDQTQKVVIIKAMAKDVIQQKCINIYSMKVGQKMNDDKLFPML